MSAPAATKSNPRSNNSYTKMGGFRSSTPPSISKTNPAATRAMPTPAATADLERGRAAVVISQWFSPEAGRPYPARRGSVAPADPNPPGRYVRSRSPQSLPLEE
jgi:hypothetical protein